MEGMIKLPQEVIERRERFFIKMHSMVNTRFGVDWNLEQLKNEFEQEMRRRIEEANEIKKKIWKKRHEWVENGELGYIELLMDDVMLKFKVRSIFAKKGIQDFYGSVGRTEIELKAELCGEPDLQTLINKFEDIRSQFMHNMRTGRLNLTDEMNLPSDLREILPNITGDNYFFEDLSFKFKGYGAVTGRINISNNAYIVEIKWQNNWSEPEQIRGGE